MGYVQSDFKLFYLMCEDCVIVVNAHNFKRVKIVKKFTEIVQKTF